MSDSFWLVEQYEALSPNLNAEEKLAELDKRVRYIQESIYKVTRQVMDGLQEKIDDANKKREAMHQEIAASVQRDQHEAQRVLRMEIAAFFLINLGAVALALASAASLLLP
jgi:hypothetical protein